MATAVNVTYVLQLYVGVEVSSRTKGVRLNFYHRCNKIPSITFRKNISATTPIFCTVSVEPLVIIQLRFVQLNTLAPSKRYSTFKYTVTLKPGSGVTLKVIEITVQSGAHDFLLTFHSNHRPISHRFRDRRRYPSKIANFPTSVYLTPPMKGFPLEFGIGARGHQSLNDGATRWSKKF